MTTLTSTSELSRTSEKRVLDRENSVFQKLRCLSIVMPVYNEFSTIKQVIQRVMSVPLPKELIIVDDCSTDSTRTLLKAMETNLESIAQEYPHSSIKMVFHEKNKGKGAALRTGFEHCTGDITIVQDADLEYDPFEYTNVIEPILRGDADVVYGSRFRGESRRVLYFWHQVGNMFLTFLSNVFTNLNLSDMETCYKAFKTDIIKAIPIRSNRFGFEPEITAKIAKLRCSIYEVPISYRGRSYAEGKKIGWKDAVSAIFTIIRFWLKEDLFKEDSGHRTLRIMEGASTYNSWLFDQCQSYLGQRVMEVGSGVGNITKLLVNRDMVLATDYSSVYVDDLKRVFEQYGNVNVSRFDLLDKETARHLGRTYSPDSIISMNVLEHIEDDAAALKNVNAILPKGGRVVLVIPAHAALYSKMDKNLGHFRRYTINSITKALKSANFEVESSRYLNMLGAIGWFVNGRIFRKEIIPSRQLRIFDLMTKSLAVEKYVRAPFGLSVLAVGRKIKDC